MDGQDYLMDELLVKYLTGEGSVSEKLTVERWINENPQHQEHFRQLRLIWNESGNTVLPSSISEEDAWVRFKQRTQQPQQVSRRIRLGSFPNLQRVASVILLLAGLYAVMQYLQRDGEHEEPAIASTASTVAETPETPSMVLPADVAEDSSEQLSTPTDERKDRSSAIKHRKPQNNRPVYQLVLNNDDQSERKKKELICNNTPCSIEICIIQSVKCGNSKSSAFASCNLIEPDESGHLHYKDLDRMAADCQSNIDEIRIKIVSTGETIVLNANSTPATAEDFFHYLTGQKKGDLQTGFFQSECNDYCMDKGLRLNNLFGDPTLQ